MAREGRRFAPAAALCMSDPDITRAARFLAEHAIVLLAAGVVLIVLALLAVVAIARLALRFRWLLRAIAEPAVQLLLTLRPVRQMTTAFRGRLVVPLGYLAVHLALGLLLATGVAAFVVIAEDVLSRGRVAQFDVAYAEALYEAGSPHGRRIFSVITAFGSGRAIAAAAVPIAVWLFATGRAVPGASWVVSQAGGGLLNFAMKQAFARARPEYADPLLAASSWSFPSGHAMGTFIFCGMAAYLLVRSSRSWLTRVLIVAAALAWCVVMAFSRLYLGVHFASDVVAGLIAGTAWVAVCVSGTEVALRRRAPGRQEG